MAGERVWNCEQVRQRLPGWRTAEIEIQVQRFPRLDSPDSTAASNGSRRCTGALEDAKMLIGEVRTDFS